MKLTIVAFSALVTIILLTLMQQGDAVTCRQVEAALIRCAGHNGAPSSPCCDGVKRVKGMAQTMPEKRAACSCVKAAATRFTDLKDEAAQSLPTKCGIHLDIPVSRTVDCDKIN